VDSREPRPLDRTDMDERVFLPVIAGDEAEAFHRVEELDRSSRLLAGQLALGPGGLLLHRNHVADHLEIRRGDFSPPVDQVEGELLPFGQAFEARPFDLADVDEHVLAAFVALDEAEALLRVEELHLAGAGADDLGGHAAAAARRAAIAAGEPAAVSAAVAIAAESVATAKSIATTRRAPVVTAKARRTAVRKRIETLFPETVPLVAPPAATSFIVTHVPNAPSLRIIVPQRQSRAKSKPPQVPGDIAHKKTMCERFKIRPPDEPCPHAYRVESLRRLAGCARTPAMDIMALLTDPAAWLAL